MKNGSRPKSALAQHNSDRSQTELSIHSRTRLFCHLDCFPGDEFVHLSGEGSMVQRVIVNPKPRPRFIEPMECTRVPKLPQGDDWVYEIKQDGYRAIGLVDGSSALLYSMSGQDYSPQFRPIVFAMKNLRQ